MADAYLMNHRRQQKKEVKYYDTKTTIGNNVTLEDAASDGAGYFGTIPASQLFTGSGLALAVGITAGTLMNDTIDWLKFYIDGKIIFRPMLPIRHSVSWIQLNTAGCVYGSKTVTKNGVTFKVRLHYGALTNPSLDSNTDKGAIGSEYNRLIYPILNSTEQNRWVVAGTATGTETSWSVEYSREQLGNASDGSSVMCVENPSSNSTSQFVFRPNSNGSVGSIATNRAVYVYGWYPILEVV